MTDTPRTDAERKRVYDDEKTYPESYDVAVAAWEFAEQLERELQKAQADAAAMREELNAIPFPCPCCSYATIHSEHCAIGSALSADAGRELLEELHRLRAELKSTREEVERARSDRNKAGVEERRKHLPTIQQLADDLAKAKAQCSAKDAALKSAKAFIDFQLGWVSNTELQRQVESALSTNAGRDYVHRSEVEKAYDEGFNEGKAHSNPEDNRLASEFWNQSRARKVATGELNK